MKIALDLDGVIFNLVEGIRLAYKAESYEIGRSAELPTKDPTEWDFSDWPAYARDFAREAITGTDAYRLAPAYEGSFEFVRDLKNAGHEIVFITARPKTNEMIDITEDALADLGVYHLASGVHVVGQSDKLNYEFDVLLDDNPALEWESRVITLKRPWNNASLSGPVPDEKWAIGYEDFLDMLRLEVIKPEREKVNEPPLVTKETAPTQALRKNDGKPQLSQILLFKPALEHLATVMTQGREKYPDVSPGVPNWVLGGKPDEEYLDSCLRHLTALVAGDKRDEESGQLHAAHAVWNLLALMTLNGDDDE